MPQKLVVLISGSGTNLQAIIDAIASENIPDATISLVISNRKNAYGLERARSVGIRTAYLNLVPYGRKYPSSDPNVKYGPEARKEFDADLVQEILAAEPDMVVMAGFMHIVSTSFLAPLAKASIPILNLHPALPGEFNGAEAIERAHEAFQQGEIRRTGVMVHEVIEEVDSGQPVVTEEVDIREGDSLDDLKERMHAVEHRLIVEGVKIVLAKRTR